MKTRRNQETPVDPHDAMGALARLGPQPPEYGQSWERWVASVFNLLEASAETTTATQVEKEAVLGVLADFRPPDGLPNAAGPLLDSFAELHGQNPLVAGLLLTYCSARRDTLAKLIRLHEHDHNFQRLLEVCEFDPRRIIKEEQKMTVASPETLSLAAGKAGLLLDDFGTARDTWLPKDAQPTGAAIHVDSGVLEFFAAADRRAENGWRRRERVVVYVLGQQTAAAEQSWRIDAIEYNMFDSRLSRRVRFHDEPSQTELHFAHNQKPGYQLLSQREARGLLHDIEQLQKMLKAGTADILPHYY